MKRIISVTLGVFILSLFLVLPAAMAVSAVNTAESEEILYGDVDGDGVVDVWDVVCLLRYIAGWDVFINLYNADVNGDGVITSFDVTHLLRHLAKWDGYEILGPK